MQYFINLLKYLASYKGKRLAVIAYDIQGQISKLTNIITENKGNIISLVVVDPKSLTEVKEIIIRLRMRILIILF